MPLPTPLLLLRASAPGPTPHLLSPSHPFHFSSFTQHLCGGNRGPGEPAAGLGLQPGSAARLCLPAPAPPGLSAPPKATCWRWPPGSAHEKLGKLPVPAGTEDAGSSLSLPVSVSFPWVPSARPACLPHQITVTLLGRGSGSAHGPQSLFSPFWCLTHAAPAPSFMTSGLCPHPRSQISPHPCPHSLAVGGLAGWVSGHQAITTEPAAAPRQPGMPLLALPGDEAWGAGRGGLGLAHGHLTTQGERPA